LQENEGVFLEDLFWEYGGGLGKEGGGGEGELGKGGGGGVGEGAGAAKTSKDATDHSIFSSDNFSHPENETDAQQIALNARNPIFSDDSQNEIFIFGKPLEKEKGKSADFRRPTGHFEKLSEGESPEFDLKNGGFQKELDSDDIEKLLDQEFNDDKMKELFEHSDVDEK
jgi:hypothetical protein